MGNHEREGDAEELEARLKKVEKERLEECWRKNAIRKHLRIIVDLKTKDPTIIDPVRDAVEFILREMGKNQP